MAVGIISKHIFESIGAGIAKRVSDFMEEDDARLIERISNMNPLALCMCSACYKIQPMFATKCIVCYSKDIVPFVNYVH